MVTPTLTRTTSGATCASWFSGESANILISVPPLHGEPQKAPARAAARAPPDPLRHPRPTSSSCSHFCHYHSPSADSFLSLVCPELCSFVLEIFGSTPRCDPPRRACTIELCAHPGGT